jgi:hypothetical protein
MTYLEENVIAENEENKFFFRGDKTIALARNPDTRVPVPYTNPLP